MYGTRNIYQLATEHQADERRRAESARAAAVAAATPRPAMGSGRTPARRSWLRWPALRDRPVGETIHA